MWSLAVYHEERRGQARPWGLLQSTAPIRPPHHQPSTWLLRREGVTSTHLAWRGASDAAAGNGQVCGPADVCEEDAHKGVFRELMGAGCRWGYGSCVCSCSPRRPTTTTSHPVTIYGPNSTHPSAQCSYEPWWVTCYSYTSLRRSLLALLSMVQCVVSALVDLHKPLVLFQVLSLLRHLPQECTLQ